MTGLIAYAVLAIAILLVSFWFFVKGTGAPAESGHNEPSFGCEPLDVTSLRLAERIFDPSDRDWLRNEVCFPQAAEALERHRKTLAIEWLKAFRKSFNELVRTPDTAESSSPGSPGLGVLWLMLRFQFLIGYALVTVKAFGPYHRIVPILGPLQSLGRLRFEKARLGHAAAERIR